MSIRAVDLTPDRRRKDAVPGVREEICRPTYGARKIGYYYVQHYHLDSTKTFLISQKALIIEEGKILLLKDIGRIKWELPGGLLELGEDLAGGLKREVYEETAIDIAIGRPISIGDAWVSGFVFRDGRILDARIIIVTFLCEKLAGSIQLSDEHSDYMWANPSRLLELDLAPDCSLALNTFLASQIP